MIANLVLGEVTVNKEPVLLPPVQTQINAQKAVQRTLVGLVHMPLVKGGFTVRPRVLLPLVKRVIFVLPTL